MQYFLETHESWLPSFTAEDGLVLNSYMPSMLVRHTNVTAEPMNSVANNNRIYFAAGLGCHDIAFGSAVLPGEAGFEAFIFISRAWSFLWCTLLLPLVCFAFVNKNEHISINRVGIAIALYLFGLLYSYRHVCSTCPSQGPASTPPSPSRTKIAMR